VAPQWWRRGFLLDIVFLLPLGTQGRSPPGEEVEEDADVVVVELGVEEDGAAL
jgi:hypothetical protein